MPDVCCAAMAMYNSHCQIEDQTGFRKSLLAIPQLFYDCLAKKILFGYNPSVITIAVQKRNSMRDDTYP